MTKFYKKLLCNVCGKDTENANGWHLKYDLDFCSNKCVADFIERTERFIDHIQAVWVEKKKVLEE